MFTGLLAYYLHETNPRTAPPPGETLAELLRWKRDKRLSEQQSASSDNEVEAKLQELLREDKAKGEHAG